MTEGREPEKYDCSGSPCSVSASQQFFLASEPKRRKPAWHGRTVAFLASRGAPSSTLSAKHAPDDEALAPGPGASASLEFYSTAWPHCAAAGLVRNLPRDAGRWLPRSHQYARRDARPVPSSFPRSRRWQSLANSHATQRATAEANRSSGAIHRVFRPEHWRWEAPKGHEKATRRFCPAIRQRTSAQL